jgi:hypothetical protein
MKWNPLIHSAFILNTYVDYHICVEYAYMYEREGVPALAGQARLHL